MCLLLAKADLSDIVYADHIPEGRGTWVFFFFFFPRKPERSCGNN